MEHGEVVLGTLFVASGDAAELLEAVEEPLHPVARPVSLPVEASSATLIALGGNHRPDVASAQVLARGLPGEGLVSGYAPRSQTRTAAPPRDRATIEEGWKSRAVVALATGQLKGDGLAGTLGSDVDLGREPAPAPAERLARDPPFSSIRRAPAAC